LEQAVVRTAGFLDYNLDGQYQGAPEGVRISGPGASVAQDLEPEYIAVSHDSKTAWVTLQENNAMAIIDISQAHVEKLVALGNKDHSIEGNGLDASNSDGMINIRTWPVFGTYMPDSIASYKVKGKTYLVTANEGDGREYIYEADSEAACESAGHEWDDGDCIAWLDEARVRSITMDPTVFPDGATLRDNANLGRLKIINTEGDIDNDGDYDELHAYGARSITIWDENGQRVADTGDAIEVATALALPDHFNSTNDENDTFDDRSDDKGPEPEGVVVGKFQGRDYAFVGLERIGGVMIFDVSDPAAPRYVSYTNNRDFLVDAEDPAAGDLGPEGLVYIKEDDSPNGGALLVVGNEVSGSTTIYQVVND
ncbi:MAG TPA: choice-of-anchor I family protein, partial [Xanthomonadales bacterium]|nr:choice-of-anchor I family protein [Xanthomonadales bacterium]